MAQVPVGVLARPGSGLRARLSVAAQVFRGNRLRRGEDIAKKHPPAWVFVNVPMNGASSSDIRARGAWRGQGQGR
jgi:nicotinate-nucleotide adenylyltransferase